MSIRNKYILDNAVDANWFLQLKSINRPLLLDSLEITPDSLKSEKSKVISIPGYNPSFSYKKLDSISINDAAEKLSKLRELLCQTETDSSILKLYVDKIDELLDENSILLAAVNNDVEGFNVSNQKRYGSLSIDFIANDLLKLQRKYDLFTGFDFYPNDFSVNKEKMKKTVDSVFSQWPSISGSVGILSAAEVKSVWEVELAKISPDWKIQISSNVFHLKVSSKKLTVFIPETIRMRGDRVAAMFAHEIGTHVYRREEGKKSKLQLLSIGFAKYQKAEEGIALVRENASVGIYGLRGGFDKYLALAYSGGLIDGEKKDFSQTFKFLKEYYYCRHGYRHLDSKSELLAVDRAWLSTVRVFRGGNPAVPGNCFYRDKIYREGLFNTLKLLENNPEQLENSHLGKFDPGNDLQRESAQRFCS